MRSIRAATCAIRALLGPIITIPFAVKMTVLVCAPFQGKPKRRSIMTTSTYKESILTHVASISAIVIAAILSLTQIALLLQ